MARRSRRGSRSLSRASPARSLRRVVGRVVIGHGLQATLIDDATQHEDAVAELDADAFVNSRTSGDPSGERRTSRVISRCLEQVLYELGHTRSSETAEPQRAPGANAFNLVRRPELIQRPRDDRLRCSRAQRLRGATYHA